MFPANARALLLPPSGCGVLLGDGTFSCFARSRRSLSRTVTGSQTNGQSSVFEA